MKFANKEFEGPFLLKSDELPRSGAVYVILHNDEVLYVGLTANLCARMPVIAANLLTLPADASLFYWSFSETQISEARRLEEVLVSTMRPKLNKVRPRGVRSDISKGTSSWLAPAVLDAFDLLHRRIFGQRQFYILIGGISGVIAILSLFSDPFAYYLYESIGVRRENMPSLSFTSLLIAVISFSFVYLQSAGKSDESVVAPKELARLKLQNKRLTEELHDLSMQFSTRLDEIEGREPSDYLSEDEKGVIVEAVVSRAGAETIKAIFLSEASALRDEMAKQSEISQIKSCSEGMLNRLRREISDLRRRANINLLIGMAITAGGLYLLWTTVSIVDSSELLRQLAGEDASSNARFLKNLLLPLIPRAMLVVFLEIFAYFFLQLYKSGLSEIKYFQNELTNVESRILAVEFGFVAGNRDHVKTSLDSLAKTERNFVLEKGQTTVELERAKADAATSKNLLKIIPDILKAKK
jgi:hypothetical protein